MPERERAAGAGSPLLYFQLASEQKGQWNPSRRERWNPLVRCCPTGQVNARFAWFVHGLHGLCTACTVYSAAANAA